MKKRQIALLCFVFFVCFQTQLIAEDSESNIRSSPVEGNRSQTAPVGLSKPDAHHALLSELVGTWDYKLSVRLGKDKWVQTTGVAVRQSIMGGHYFLADFDVEMLPGPGGKLEKANFKGKSIEGYDLVKQKFVSVWIDNASTGITTFEGTYDPGSHTFTYLAQTESQPGKVTKVREIISVSDHDHYSLTWYEEHGEQQIKTVEINYTRRT